MYKEKNSGNDYFAGGLQTVEAKETALNFAENLLSIIDGENFDSIIINAEDAETKLYINLLPLFDDVAEIVDSKIELEDLNTDNKIHIIADISYISENMKKKRRRIEYDICVRSNDTGGHEITSAA